MTTTSTPPPQPATGRPWDDPPGSACVSTTADSCPVCARAFRAVGRQRYCSTTCRKTAHRRRQAAATTVVTVPPVVGRRERTVFQCPECDGLQLGVQRCEDCAVFGRSLGLGGLCPHCQEPVSVQDLDLTTA